jgi:hypothetical protein
MLIVGYCTGIRSERRLCEEVHSIRPIAAFARLRLDGSVPDYFNVPEEPTRALARERRASSHAEDCFEHGKKDRCFFN